MVSEVLCDPRYKSCIDDWVNYILNDAKYTPNGLIYIDRWGTLRHASNVAHVCAQLTRVGLWESECDSFVKRQIHYALGDTGRSFVVGFGSDPPCRPHHASSSCPDLPEPCDWDDFSKSDCNSQANNFLRLVDWS